jgi:hypothetical protein
MDPNLAFLASFSFARRELLSPFNPFKLFKTHQFLPRAAGEDEEGGLNRAKRLNSLKVWNSRLTGET